MLNRVKRAKTVAKKQHHFKIKFTGIFTLRVLLAVKISFEGFGKVNDSIITNAFDQTDLNWTEKLKKENVKKYGVDKSENMQELSKRVKFFVQRGFEREMIRKVIN